MKYITVCIILLTFTFSGFAQEKRDKSRYGQSKNAFMEKIGSELEQYYQSKNPKAAVNSFEMDFSGYVFPTDLKQYTLQWHNPPVSQGHTNTCWAFSTVSFLESELYRSKKLQIKLSPLFVVYYEYLEKAARFVDQRGDSAFEEGGEANAVTRVIKKYGIVPLADYTGLEPGQPFHDHRALIQEMKEYLDGVKKNAAWNLDTVLATIKSILNHYIGTPPIAVNWKGKNYAPLAFCHDVLQLNPGDYVDIYSALQSPYWQQVEYIVTDNWWHDKSYYNVPLDVYMDALKKAVKAGYTVSIGGDVSEPGYNSAKKVGLIPSFDIPREYIDEHARQFRVTNGTTTDDHGIHIVGYCQDGGDTWFVIKDSGSGAHNVDPKGYRFIREDFVKLKWLSFMVHREAVADILAKFPKK